MAKAGSGKWMIKYSDRAVQSIDEARKRSHKPNSGMIRLGDALANIEWELERIPFEVGLHIKEYIDIHEFYIYKTKNEVIPGLPVIIVIYYVVRDTWTVVIDSVRIT